MENTFFYNHYTWCRYLDGYLRAIKHDYYFPCSEHKEKISFYKSAMRAEERKPLNPYER